jgi:hypothetical protein
MNSNNIVVRVFNPKTKYRYEYNIFENINLVVTLIMKHQIPILVL